MFSICLFPCIFRWMTEFWLVEIVVHSQKGYTFSQNFLEKLKKVKCSASLICFFAQGDLELENWESWVGQRDYKISILSSLLSFLVQPSHFRLNFFRNADLQFLTFFASFESATFPSQKFCSKLAPNANRDQLNGGLSLSAPWPQITYYDVRLTSASYRSHP